MNNKQFLFFIETKKASKKQKQKGLGSSDDYYIRTIMKHYQEENINIKINYKFNYVAGKSNLVSRQTISDAKTFLNFDEDGTDKYVFLIADTDKPEIYNDQEKLNKKLILNCDNNGLYLCWFNEKIEHVLLGKSISKDKSTHARNYTLTNKEYIEIFDVLNHQSPGKGKSNFIFLLNKLCN